ncbi:hypothetical protein, partial [Caballeronia udeis]|uniref:hypothetical protein n=1 Tax=Caballeronia udeis TaxID=1232866 RepID=UPI001E3C7FAD
MKGGSVIVGMTGCQQSANAADCATPKSGSKCSQYRGRKKTASVGSGFLIQREGTFGLLPHAFGLNMQRRFHLEAIRLAVVHA